MAADDELHRAGDVIGVATDRLSVFDQDVVLVAEFLDGLRRAVPDICVFGDDAESELLAAGADHDRRVRLLDRLGFANSSLELVGGAVEVERLLLGPHPPADRAGLREVSDRLRGWHDWNPARLEFANRRVGGCEWVLGREQRPAGTDPEDEPSFGDDVSGRRHLGEHTRHRDEHDARLVRLYLTEQAKSVRNAIETERDTLALRATAGLTDAEQRVLKRALTKIIDEFADQAPGPADHAR